MTVIRLLIEIRLLSDQIVNVSMTIIYVMSKEAPAEIIVKKK
jgi:hypothetical protein